MKNVKDKCCSFDFKICRNVQRLFLGSNFFFDIFQVKRSKYFIEGETFFKLSVLDQL